jgi:hypothetical protein
MQPGEGERLHAERRQRFWKMLGALAACGAVAGFFGGLAMGYGDGGGARHLPLMRTIGAVSLLIGMIAAAYGSWRFFQQVDELEIADNLWGSLVGFYIYALLFPTWWMLAKLERAPEPNDWIIYAASMIGGVAVYAYRKWQQR